MNYETYEPLITEQDTCFSFQSIGKNGTVEKVISFSPLNEDHYNLSLLDYNCASGVGDDESRTDNGDLPKIMATVRRAILLFLDKHPDKGVYFEGSLKERYRIRLFQIYVNKFFSFLRHELTILGERNQRWQEFEENVQFERFIIAKKELNLVW